MLLLHHAFAHHLVHRRFNEGRADRLAVSVAFAEVRDELLIVADVGLEFAYTLGHLLRQWRGNLGKLQIATAPVAAQREILAIMPVRKYQGFWDADQVRARVTLEFLSEKIPTDFARLGGPWCCYPGAR
jgi:hypothetical protein